MAEVGALEGRAEALEENETRAALSHAEDDRLFMRGFAQRPPAKQTDLVAAMENGPELKPIETRRLAAMQAQAAVTERSHPHNPSTEKRSEVMTSAKQSCCLPAATAGKATQPRGGRP